MDAQESPGRQLRFELAEPRFEAGDVVDLGAEAARFAQLLAQVVGEPVRLVPRAGEEEGPSAQQTLINESQLSQ